MKNYFLFLLLFLTSLLYSQSKKELIAENTTLKEENSKLIADFGYIKNENETLKYELNLLNSRFQSLKYELENVKSSMIIPSSGVSQSDLLKTNLLDLSKDFFLDSYQGLEEIKTTSKKSDVCSDSPKSLEELNGGYKVFFSSSNKVSEVDGNLFLLNLSSENSNTLVNYKFLQYKKGNCLIDGKIRKVVWGVGVDLKMNIVAKKKKAKISSLPSLAAAVNYDDVEANFSLDVIGITGQKIIEKLNLSGEFNVENYGKVISAIDEIINNISSEGVNIEPQLISID